MDVPSLITGALIGAVPSGVCGYVGGRRLQRAQRWDDARALCGSLHLEASAIARMMAEYRGSKSSFVSELPAHVGAGWAANRARLSGYVHTVDLAAVDDAYGARLSRARTDMSEKMSWCITRGTWPVQSQLTREPSSLLDAVEGLRQAQAAFALAADILRIYASPPPLSWLPGRNPRPILERPAFRARYPIRAWLLLPDLTRSREGVAPEVPEGSRLNCKQCNQSWDHLWAQLRNSASDSVMRTCGCGTEVGLEGTGVGVIAMGLAAVWPT